MTQHGTGTAAAGGDRVSAVHRSEGVGRGADACAEGVGASRGAHDDRARGTDA